MTPDSTIEARFRALAEGNSSPIHRIAIQIGSIADYRALSRFHYLTGPPATHVRVLRARESASGQLVGVLVVSMPTLDGSWRELAWPGRFRGPDRAQAARTINAELRTISRVVVDPRWRAVGVASRLVRSYLAHPLSHATEAIAAMGAACPFFKAAGMREYILPVRPADARLRDALHARRLRPGALYDHPCARRLTSDPFIARELRIWARSRKSTRRLRDFDEIRNAAATALLSNVRAYAHTRAPPGKSGDTAEGKNGAPGDRTGMHASLG